MSVFSFFGVPKENTSTNSKAEIYVDVREAFERSQGHLQGSINIPLGDIQSGNYSLPKNKTIAIYCRSGSRSGFATHLLQAAGYKVYNAGGIIYGIDNIPIVK